MDHDEDCPVCKKYLAESTAAWRMERHNQLAGLLAPNPEPSDQ